MPLIKDMKVAKSIKLSDEPLTYPFSLSLLKNFSEINLNNNMIILVGDNGSGKSTLLEIIAAKLKLYRISDDLDYNDLEFKEIKNSIKHFDLNYSVKPKGFFFRSEDFITYIRYLHKVKQEAYEELKTIDEEYKNKSSLSRSLAKMPHYRTLSEVQDMYQNELSAESHGESYLDFFKSRLKKGSLYLLDEAEMPLSISNQLALMLMMKDSIDIGCQFIIATHSPILMSYPGALIYEISESGINKISYEDIESIKLMKDFLNHKERYLRNLFENSI